MIVLEGIDRELYDRVQEQNLIRQYDLLTNCIEIGLKQGPTALDKYTLWALNHVAVANISQFGGRFREEPIYVGNHVPPHFLQVADLMDRFISTIHENWFNWTAGGSASSVALGISPLIRGHGGARRTWICARRGVGRAWRRALGDVAAALVRKRCTGSGYRGAAFKRREVARAHAGEPSFNELIANSVLGRREQITNHLSHRYKDRVQRSLTLFYRTRPSLRGGFHGPGWSRCASPRSPWPPSARWHRPYIRTC